MTALWFALLLGAQPLQTPAPAPGDDGPRHWEDGQLRWRSIPIPTVPSGETGTVQAEISCTVAGRGRVRGCRVGRQLPEGTRFGQGAVSRMGRAEVRMERGLKPGDTFTLVLWACSDPLAACERLPWPEA